MHRSLSVCAARKDDSEKEAEISYARAAVRLILSPGRALSIVHRAFLCVCVCVFPPLNFAPTSRSVR